RLLQPRDDCRYGRAGDAGTDGVLPGRSGADRRRPELRHPAAVDLRHAAGLSGDDGRLRTRRAGAAGAVQRRIRTDHVVSVPVLRRGDAALPAARILKRERADDMAPARSYGFNVLLRYSLILRLCV